VRYVQLLPVYNATNLKLGMLQYQSTQCSAGESGGLAYMSGLHLGGQGNLRPQR